MAVVGPPERAPRGQDEPQGRSTTLDRAIALGRRFLPWGSLGAGIVGALMMDRGPDRAVVVAGVAVGTWALLLVTLLLRQHPASTKHRLIAGAWFSSLALTQWAIQLSLFFSLPFYWRAWSGEWHQLVFLVPLSLAAAISLWDPWTERLLHRPGLAPILPGLASFAGLNAVLPGLGFSNSTSLWIAASSTVVALPIGVVTFEPSGPRRLRAWSASLAVAVGLLCGLALGAARFVPAAPLALLDARIGRYMDGRDVGLPIEQIRGRPGKLVCATAISAPLGVREKLFHVWRQDGEVRDRIELEVRGGRKEGFRTWSRKRNFGEHPAGQWTCSIETRMGQSLGRATVELLRARL